MYRYIRAMGFGHGEIRHHIKGFSNPITEHIVKIILYKDAYPQLLHGWVSDIAVALYNASTYTLDGIKHIKKRDYKELLFFGFGDLNHDDASAILRGTEYRLSHKQNRPYDTVTVTDSMVYDLVSIGNEIRDSMSEYISKSKGATPIETFEKMVGDIYRKYGYSV